MFSNRFCLNDKIYEPFARIVIALTNFHVKCFPLRADDGSFDRRYNKRILETYEMAQRRRRERQERTHVTRNVRQRLTVKTAGLAGIPEVLNPPNDADGEENGI